MSTYGPPTTGPAMRVIGAVQGSIAGLFVVGMAIWGLSADLTSLAAESSSDYRDLASAVGYLMTAVVLWMIGPYIALAGLAVFVAKGSLAARVTSCALWVYLGVGYLPAVRTNGAYVLITVLALVMVVAITVGDRISIGSGQPQGNGVAQYAHTPYGPAITPGPSNSPRPVPPTLGSPWSEAPLQAPPTGSISPGVPPWAASGGNGSSSS